MHMSEDLSLSATEAGLLTIAERRGHVVTAKVVDRADPVSVERRDLLERLLQRGLLSEASATEAEIAYAITDQGQQALSALDLRRD